MSLRFLTGGESHGPALTVILEGIPAGLPMNERIIEKELKRRQSGFGAGERMKLENDQARILGGVLAGMTTGSPIVLSIENQDHKKWKNQSVKAFSTPRPGHADLTGAVKYGYSDFRLSLERASARETAARVAMGAVVKHFLEQFGIHVGGYVSAIGELSASLDHIPVEDRAIFSEQNDVRCPDSEFATAFHNLIEKAIENRNTLGGIIEVVATGLPIGLGSFTQWDKRLDALLGMAVLSIPAIKGVEIGSAFANAKLAGTVVQDAIKLENKKIKRPTNHAGGLEGGITNGEPLILRAAMKPIATTLTPQKTVDLVNQKETDTVYERSDSCPVPRAVPVVEAMVAFTLANALAEKIGGDSLSEMHPRFETLRKATINDLEISGDSTIFWQEN